MGRFTDSENRPRVRVGAVAGGLKPRLILKPLRVAQSAALPRHRMLMHVTFVPFSAFLFLRPLAAASGEKPITSQFDGFQFFY
jgi:hypothetical protein